VAQSPFKYLLPKPLAVGREPQNRPVAEVRQVQRSLLLICSASPWGVARVRERAAMNARRTVTSLRTMLGNKFVVHEEMVAGVTVARCNKGEAGSGRAGKLTDRVEQKDEKEGLFC